MARVVLEYAQAALEDASGYTVNPGDFGDLRAMFAALMGVDRLPENEWQGQLVAAFAHAVMGRHRDPRGWTREPGASGDAIHKYLLETVDFVPAQLTAATIDRALAKATPVGRGGRGKHNWHKVVSELIEGVDGNHEPSKRS